MQLSETVTVLLSASVKRFFFSRMRDFSSICEIFPLIGCHKPCRYRDYVVLEVPIDVLYNSHSYFAVDLWMPSIDITILTKIPAYPQTSLIAEFGGTFSLFFILSIMTLWDGMK